MTIVENIKSVLWLKNKFKDKVGEDMLLKATQAQRPDLPQPIKISSNNSKSVKTKLGLYRGAYSGLKLNSYPNERIYNGWIFYHKFVKNKFYWRNSIDVDFHFFHKSTAQSFWSPKTVWYSFGLCFKQPATTANTHFEFWPSFHPCFLISKWQKIETV